MTGYRGFNVRQFIFHFGLLNNYIVQFFIHSVQCQPDKTHEVGWHRLAIVTQRGRFYGFVICRFLGGLPHLLFWRHSQCNTRPDCAISIAWRYRHNRIDLTVLAILQAKSDQEMSNSSHVSHSLASCYITESPTPYLHEDTSLHFKPINRVVLLWNVKMFTSQYS